MVRWWRCTSTIALDVNCVLTGLFARATIAVWVDFPPVYVPLWAIAIALSFSGSVGFYPAWKAARLDPIEALRST